MSTLVEICTLLAVDPADVLIPGDEQYQWGYRLVHADRTSRDGYQWPAPGHWARQNGPADGAGCGQGLHIALCATAATAMGYRPLLQIVAWRHADELGRDEGHKVRASAVWVGAEALTIGSLVRSGANLSGADLYRANLSGEDLHEANLYRANLNEANLSGADLHEDNLCRADLSGANLSGADLSGADLSGADLYRADLYRANLRETNLSGADLSGADLSGADLSGANVSACHG